MIILQGTPASSGVAIGPACIVSVRKAAPIERKCGTDPAHELSRLQKARVSAKQEIEKIYLNACNRIGRKNSIIFQIHIMMLEDEGFQQSIINSIVKDQTTAEYAVWYNGNNLYKTFTGMEDEYMRARSEDMLDICHRLLSCLNQDCCTIPAVEDYLLEPSVLCLPHAFPSEVVQSNQDCILGLVSQYGSITSHSMLLARSMGLPAVTALGAAFHELKPGGEIIVDGDDGRVYTDPTPKVRIAYEKRVCKRASPQRECQLPASGGTD